MVKIFASGDSLFALLSRRECSYCRFRFGFLSGMYHAGVWLN